MTTMFARLFSGEKDVEPSHPILSSAFPIVQSTETLTFREDHQLEPSVHTSSAWIGPWLNSNKTLQKLVNYFIHVHTLCNDREIFRRFGDQESS